MIALKERISINNEEKQEHSSLTMLMDPHSVKLPHKFNASMIAGLYTLKQTHSNSTHNY